MNKWLRIYESFFCLSSANYCEDHFHSIPLILLVMSLGIEQVFDNYGIPLTCAFVFTQILSTNIAETSVTIDDVVFVIDSGKVKEVGN